MPILSSFPDCVGGAGSTEGIEEITERVSELEEAVTSKIENSPGVITTEHFAEGALNTIYTATIGTDWVGEEAPYTQEVSIPGILAENIPAIGVKYSDDYTLAMAERAAWGNIYKIVVNDDSITAYSTGVTDTAVTVQINVFHGQANTEGGQETAPGIIILSPLMYGNDDLSTKEGVEGQLYFKVVE